MKLLKEEGYVVTSALVIQQLSTCLPWLSSIGVHSTCIYMWILFPFLPFVLLLSLPLTFQHEKYENITDSSCFRKFIGGRKKKRSVTLRTYFRIDVMSPKVWSSRGKKQKKHEKKPSRNEENFFYYPFEYVLFFFFK